MRRNLHLGRWLVARASQRSWVALTERPVPQGDERARLVAEVEGLLRIERRRRGQLAARAGRDSAARVALAACTERIRWLEIARDLLRLAGQ